MVDKNPSVFEHWETPLEITEYVYCDFSEIIHLSKYLTFSGKNDQGKCASFGHCKSLQTATGTFHGYVTFKTSGIQRIEELHILKPNIAQTADFSYCKSLKIATGTYPGKVNFSDSGAETIHNLHIQTAIQTANFSYCPNLKNLRDLDLSKPIEIEPEKLIAEKERRAVLKFNKETKPQELPSL